MAWSTSASGQASEAEVSKRLLDKPMYLRGFWAEDKLRFSIDGAPEGQPTPASFTVAGISVDQVSLSGDKLRLQGTREGLEIDEDGNVNRVVMRTGAKFGKGKPERVDIEIDGHGSHDFGAALDAIFANQLTDLIAVMPEFWRPYAQANFFSAAEGDEDSQVPSKAAGAAGKQKSIREAGTAHVGGSIKPPRVTKSVDPSFTEFARRMKYSGQVEVYCWVDESGIPSHIRIAKAAGLGLDEQAIRAVSQYHFQPATRDGQSVKVDLYINVNFQIF